MSGEFSPSGTRLHPIWSYFQGSKVVRNSGVKALVIEELNGRIGHVRICGGLSE
jgi:hypothetical protein